MSAIGSDARAGGFSPAVMAGVLLVGLVAFVVFFAGQAFDSGPRAELTGGAHALSKSAVGYAGAVQLLNATGRPAVVARGPVSQRPGSRQVLVVTLDQMGDASVFDAPAVERFPGPVLVVLPKWSTAWHEERLGWVRKAGLRPLRPEAWLELPEGSSGPDETPATAGETTYDEAIEQARERRDVARKALEAAEQAKAEGKTAPPTVAVARAGDRAAHTFRTIDAPSDMVVPPPTRSGPIERLQTFSTAAGWRPVAVDEIGRPVMIENEEGGLFVLADPDLMNTQGLANLETAGALLALLDGAFGPDAAYVFDVTLHGYERSRSLLRQAMEPPFLAATLCVLAAVVLMGWHAFFRFGRAREEGRIFALGKRALADNQAELFRMTRREHRLGGRYGALVRDLAARAVGAPRELTPEAAEDLLDRLGEGGRTSWPYSTLRRDLEQARDRTELVRAAQRLHQWRLEMTRERQ